MKILFIAPQPFYQDRGTPINVDLAVKALSLRGDSVDLLVYHEGEDKHYANIKLHRIKPFIPINNIKCGFTLKKVLADLFVFIKVLKLVRKNKYDLIHAGEEAVFIALLVKKFMKIPYIYDMDSLLSRQMINKYQWLKKFEKVMIFFENLAVKNAMGIAPVCKALENDARKMGGKNIISWEDVSLLKETDHQRAEDIRKEYKIEDPILMYIGNLESYQGIELLLESFAIALEKNNFSLLIIGGDEESISKYKMKTIKLGIHNKIYFLGQQPTKKIKEYMNQADALVSPRTLGYNTPMKIYSYLHSGIPVLATKLYTHTQVVDLKTAVLAEPVKEKFAEGIIEVLTNKELRENISKNAVNFIEENHTYSNLKEKIDLLYSKMQREIEINGE